MFEYFLSLYTAPENVDEVIIKVNSTSENMVLNDDDYGVTEEIFVEAKSGQLWIKGIPDTDGYFTLRNKEGNLFLTPKTNFFETKGM